MESVAKKSCFVDDRFNAEAQSNDGYGLWAIGIFFVQFVQFVAKNETFVRFVFFVVKKSPYHS
ncbi:hypothetical protein SE18_02520 [Herpetosiphon geysericola]|uniref:Uncharacterized protein n=1 Tax=Herpetosiphon geysericola TaxID=70996 RepID=A0A0P6Z2A2_9CHLR|nr:hypothetical protein SE18_02520 [Herpetosiphon geysericola]